MVDALASGASVLRDVEVRVFSRVPSKESTFGSVFCLLGLSLCSSVTRVMSFRDIAKYMYLCHNPLRTLIIRLLL